VTGRNLDRVSDELLELATASAVTPADDARRIELDRRLVGRWPTASSSST